MSSERENALAHFPGIFQGFWDFVPGLGFLKMRATPICSINKMRPCILQNAAVFFKMRPCIFKIQPFFIKCGRFSQMRPCIFKMWPFFWKCDCYSQRWPLTVSATNFLLPKINNIVDIWQYSNNYRFPHCRLRTILSKIGNAHTFLLPFSALPITNNIVENRKQASMFHCRNTEISSVAENYKLSHVLTYIIMFLVKK